MKEQLLEISPFSDDGGHLIGKRPSSVPLGKLKALFPVQSPIKAIRAKCLECCGNQPSEVRKCTATDCPLWPFRFGKNVFHGRAK